MDRDGVVKDFKAAVNMTPSALERWLQRPESKEVGWGSGESVGHRSGRRIVDLKRTKKAELTDDDLRHMKKVVGYVKRHLAQGGPQDDVRHSKWRYSLMNWGHDPLK